MSYSDLLKKPAWQKKRLEILERDGWKCVKCGQKEEMLSVHHLYYTNGAMPWEYENNALITLCTPCHDEAEKIRLEAKSLVYALPDGGISISKGIYLGLKLKSSADCFVKFENMLEVSGACTLWPGIRPKTFEDLILRNQEYLNLYIFRHFRKGEVLTIRESTWDGFNRNEFNSFLFDVVEWYCSK